MSIFLCVCVVIVVKTIRVIFPSSRSNGDRIEFVLFYARENSWGYFSVVSF